MDRIKIERAIYQFSKDGNYFIIGYDKNVGNTRTLANFKEISDARAYRDEHIRKAIYGKGIQKMSSGRYSANILCPPSKYIKSNVPEKVYNVYIGSFDTPNEARAARVAYIENLK